MHTKQQQGQNGDGAPKHKKPKRLGIDQAFVLLILAGLVLYMGGTWWLHPPCWEAISIREYVLRMLDALFLMGLVAVWITTPVIGGWVFLRASRDLLAHVVISARQRRRRRRKRRARNRDDNEDGKSAAA